MILLLHVYINTEISHHNKFVVKMILLGFL